MKLNGFVGKGTGKLGSSVFAVSGGEQIVRQYNPNVSNPSTDAQVAQRAKLKLMSQLAVVLAPGLAFKKDGLISPRNQFISRNIGKCTYTAADGAQIDVLDLVITPGTSVGPTYDTELHSDIHKVAVSFPTSSNSHFDGFVVVSVSGVGSEPESQLNFNEVVFVQRADDPEGTSVYVKYTGGDSFIFAYGLTGVKSAGSINYENYLVQREQGIASLEVVKRIVSSYQNVSANVNKKAVAL